MLSVGCIVSSDSEDAIESNFGPSVKHCQSPLGVLIIGSIAALMLVLSGCSSQNNYENRRFFLPEQGLETHGRKTWFDHVVELDPGGIKDTVAPDYDSKAPLRVAVLPFADRGSAQYVVDKVPLTFRNKEQREVWAWTDANRTRRALLGYMAQREFVVANIYQVDAVLKEHDIDSEEKLESIPPQTLGKWLGVDAVVYGSVTHYDAYYAGLLAGWQIGADVKMVSTRDGSQLFGASGSRYDVNLSPAFDPMDIAINSAMALLTLRDVQLARAEDENAREIVLRIPRCERLEDQLIEEAQDGEFVTVAQAGSPTSLLVAGSSGPASEPTAAKDVRPPQTQNPVPQSQRSASDSGAQPQKSANSDRPAAYHHHLPAFLAKLL